MKRHWKSLLWAGLCLILLAGFAALSLGDRRTVSAMTPQLSGCMLVEAMALLEREGLLP